MRLRVQRVQGVHGGNNPVGRVLHAVQLAEHGIRLGLGYLPTDFQAVGTKLTLAGDCEVEVVGYAEAAS